MFRFKGGPYADFQNFLCSISSSRHPTLRLQLPLLPQNSNLYPLTSASMLCLNFFILCFCLESASGQKVEAVLGITLFVFSVRPYLLCFLLFDVSKQLFHILYSGIVAYGRMNGELFLKEVQALLFFNLVFLLFIWASTSKIQKFDICLLYYLMFSFYVIYLYIILCCFSIFLF